MGWPGTSQFVWFTPVGPLVLLYVLPVPVNPVVYRKPQWNGGITVQGQSRHDRIGYAGRISAGIRSCWIIKDQFIRVGVISRRQGEWQTVFFPGVQYLLFKEASMPRSITQPWTFLDSDNCIPVKQILFIIAKRIAGKPWVNLSGPRKCIIVMQRIEKCCWG